MQAYRMVPQPPDPAHQVRLGPPEGGDVPGAVRVEIRLVLARLLDLPGVRLQLAAEERLEWTA